MNLEIDHGVFFTSSKHVGRNKISANTMFTDKMSVIPRPFTLVKLFDHKNNQIISSMYSDAFSSVIFEDLNVKEGNFFVIAHDPEKKFNGVIADNIGGSSYVDE